MAYHGVTVNPDHPDTAHRGTAARSGRVAGLAFASALALSVALAGCAAVTARDLREGRLSGHLAFEADDPVDGVLSTLEEIAPRCLQKESGVMARAPGDAPGRWSVTYAFTDFGDSVTTVAVELSARPDGRTDVAIHYSPHLVERWKRYALKTRKWILLQSSDCAF